jgi:hydrogenase nickel incorporation protein HypA/HybF
VHELALADAVIRAALAAAERAGISRLTRIAVRIGELQQIAPEAFRLALQELLPPGDPRLAGVRFELEPEPARLRCRPCGRDFGLAAAAGSGDERQSEAIHFVPELAHAFLGCPTCGSPDFEVLSGRGVLLGAVEGLA